MLFVTDELDELKQADLQLDGALAAADLGLLDEILDEGFAALVEGRLPALKAEVLAHVASRSVSRDGRWLARARATVYGDAGVTVVSGSSIWHLVRGKSETRTARTRVWVRRDGPWRLLVEVGAAERKAVRASSRWRGSERIGGT